MLTSCRTHRERKEQYTKDLELEVLRLKDLFTGAARERDNATSARDQAMREAERLRQENHQLHTENQRLKGLLPPSSVSTDSGYDGMSITCDATRNNSFSTTDGFAGMTAPVVSQAPVGGIPTSAAWEDHEMRGFASDAPLQDGLSSDPGSVGTLVKQESPSSATQVPLLKELQPISINYDDLGLDFVLR